MASLSADLFYDILKRLDAAALARAGCACADFRAISNEEDLWENACASLWPSTRRDDVRVLIVSVGGFRKFYADCFTLILNKDVPVVQTNETNFLAEEWAESDYYYYDDMDELENSLPSDFVSLIDVWYKDRALYSKVIWGIPNSDNANGWFYNYPFRIDLQHSDENNENNNGEIFLSTINDLPSVPSMEQERKDGKLWRELNDCIKLSWIIVNQKMKRAVNLTSWHPLSGQRHWPTDTDFVLRFGSVLPAKEVLPCQVAECILLMKFRVTSMGSEEAGEPSTLALTELSMQIEDMGGIHLNGRCSLLLLKEALSCHRSRNYDEVLESCNLYLKAQSELKEEKIRKFSLEEYGNASVQSCLDFTELAGSVPDRQKRSTGGLHKQDQSYSEYHALAAAWNSGRALKLGEEALEIKFDRESSKAGQEKARWWVALDEALL